MRRAITQYLSKLMIISLVALGFLQPVLADTTNTIKKKNPLKKQPNVIAKKGKAADRYALLNE